MCRPWADIVKRTSAAHVVYLSVQETEKQQNKDVEQVLTKIWGCVTCARDKQLGGRDESKTLTESRVEADVGSGERPVT